MYKRSPKLYPTKMAKTRKEKNVFTASKEFGLVLLEIIRSIVGLFQKNSVWISSIKNIAENSEPESYENKILVGSRNSFMSIILRARML